LVKHRGLNLKKLMDALPWELFEAYRNQLDPRADPGPWAWMNAQVLFQFLNDEANAEVAGPILEDLQRINDLGFYTGYLLYAYQRAGIAWTQDEPGEAGAMRLFLENREAFEYGWTLYLLQVMPGKRSEHYFPAGDLNPSEEDKDKLKAHLSGWFSSIKRGDQCRPSFYKDGSKLYLRVTRGRPWKTDARWRGNDISIETWRPASEDVLTFDADRNLLCLFGGHKRDRERYLRCFAEYIAHDPHLADVALETPVFSLLPIKHGTFSYAGNNAIRRIWITEVDLVDELGTLHSLKGPQIRASMVARNLSLEVADLRRVHLRFEIQPEGATKKVEVGVDNQLKGNCRQAVNQPPSSANWQVWPLGGFFTCRTRTSAYLAAADLNHGRY